MAAEPAPRRRALIVEDEAPIRALVRLHLSLAGFDVEESADGLEAVRKARAEAFDVILLDLMLPTLDGVTICRSIRAEGANRETPILMLTARDSESDKVLGLESGADDYLTKPFGVRELVARVGALMRRRRRAEEPVEPPEPRIVSSRNLVLDPGRREASVRGKSVELTRQEFDLLYLLASRPGIVFPREALLRVWHGDTFVTERTVDTVISRLRRKIEEDPQDPELILTAWGVGYKFADVEET